jgi:hypothetical protein
MPTKAQERDEVYEELERAGKRLEARESQTVKLARQEVAAVREGLTGLAAQADEAADRLRKELNLYSPRAEQLSKV